MLRRAILAIVGTAAGTTLLITLKAGLVAGHPSAAGATAPLGPAAGEAEDPVGTTAAGAGAPAATTGAGAPTTARPTRSPGAPGTGGPAPQPTTAAPTQVGGLHAGTFAGPVVQTRYGPVQVQITVSGGRVSDVRALQTPSAHEESVQINARAAPILRQEALTAQSAAINTVSGATYTSKGYKTSLQAALDAAHRG